MNSCWSGFQWILAGHQLRQANSSNGFDWIVCVYTFLIRFICCTLWAGIVLCTWHVQKAKCFFLTCPGTWEKSFRVAKERAGTAENAAWRWAELLPAALRKARDATFNSLNHRDARLLAWPKQLVKCCSAFLCTLAQFVDFLLTWVLVQKQFLQEPTLFCHHALLYVGCVSFQVIEKITTLHCLQNAPANHASSMTSASTYPSSTRRHASFYSTGGNVSPCPRCGVWVASLSF